MMGRCADCCFADREQGSRMEDVTKIHRTSGRMDLVTERRPVEFDEIRCRLNPPGSSGWPLVEPDDWCGQFSQEVTLADLQPRRGSHDRA